MNYYELLYIVRPTVSDDDLKSIMNEIAGKISELGGEVLKNDIWGKRNLAYPIKKFKQGSYILVHYKSASNVPKPVEEKMRIKEDILRFMTTGMLKKDIAFYEKKAAQESKESQESEGNGESE